MRILPRCAAVRIIAVLPIFVVSGPATAQDSGSACYDVEVAGWSPGQLGSDSLYYLPPTRILLRDAPARTLFPQDSALSVWPAPRAMPSIHEFSWWKRVSEDTIQITWTTGFSGIRGMASGVDTLRGIVRTFTDVAGYTQLTADLTLVPTTCSAPLSPSERSQYRFSPVVRFASGDTLTIDAPVPSWLAGKDTASVVSIEQMAVGPYSGAERVEVQLRRDGNVLGVRFHYTGDTDPEVLVEALAKTLGAPTRQFNRRLRWAYWSSRLITISLHSAVRAGDGAWVVSVRSTQPTHR